MLGYLFLGILHGLFGALFLLFMGHSVFIALAAYAVIGATFTLLLSAGFYRSDEALNC